MTKFIVEDAYEIRLDRFIRRECFYLPQGIIEKHLRLGDIQVNDKKAKSSVRLKKGDVVTVGDRLRRMSRENSVDEGPIRTTDFSPAVISLARKIFDEYLICDNEDFIAINKPFDLATQGGSKVNVSVDHALAYLNNTAKTGLRLVHRLDKDTSGILIIAKNLNSAIKLTEAFKNRTLRKIYLAVTSGVPKTVKGSIKNYLGKDRSGNYDRIAETKDGKLAETFYEVLSHGKNLSTIKFMPQTGRMHQLRFHGKQLGCPILGDVKYGGEPFARMMLHAWKISVPASVLGKEYNIVAERDKFFEKYFRKKHPATRILE